MEERYAMGPIYRVQIVPGFWTLIGRRGTIGRMGMAGRGHRKGVTRRRTVAAGTGRHDRKSRRHERDQPAFAREPTSSAVTKFGRSLAQCNGWAAGPVRDWRIGWLTQ